jgi:hypothetical protein
LEGNKIYTNLRFKPTASATSLIVTLLYHGEAVAPPQSGDDELRRLLQAGQGLIGMEAEIILEGEVTAFSMLISAPAERTRLPRRTGG